MGKKIEITENEKYGKLTIVKEVEPYVSPMGHKLRRVLCLCDCGNKTIVIYNRLRIKNTKSCGCNYKEPRKHGSAIRGRQTTEYKAWCSMKYRCLNPNSKNYYLYGERGITIYPEWIKSYESFISHMGLKPSPEYSLDRIDPNGNYEPLNCRWATPKEQRLNQRRMKKI
jgi:hypothetical protein